MKRWYPRRVLLAMVVATLLSAGCGSGEKEEAHSARATPHEEREGHDHDHDHEHEHDAADDHGHDHGHDHDSHEESPSGGSFVPGKGVLLTDETREILGVEVAEVTEESLPAETRFTAKIFGEKHHHLPHLEDHRGCDVHGSGLVPVGVATNVAKGDPVQVTLGGSEPLRGVVLGVQRAAALGESEVIIGISNAISVLSPGQFIPASILHPPGAPTPVVPQSALLRTAQGAFVYTVQDDDAYLRTAVRPGAESGGRVAILDGLSGTERVVIKPVQTLWLVELRATKGGGHSH